MLPGSGHLHLQGQEGLVIVAAPAIPAGSATYPSPTTPSTMAGPATPPSPILSVSSSQSLARCTTPCSTHSTPTRAVEIATTMYIVNVGAASLMNTTLARASRLTVALMT